MKEFSFEELEKFCHDHIQQKIDHGELKDYGFDMNNVENFKSQIDIFQKAMTEGLCNGILMAGGKIKEIDID